MDYPPYLNLNQDNSGSNLTMKNGSHELILIYCKSRAGFRPAQTLSLQNLNIIQTGDCSTPQKCPNDTTALYHCTLPLCHCTVSVNSTTALTYSYKTYNIIIEFKLHLHLGVNLQE